MPCSDGGPSPVNRSEAKAVLKHMELFTDDSPILLLYTIRLWLAQCADNTNSPLIINRAIIDTDAVSVHFTFKKTKHLLVFPLDDIKSLYMVKGGSTGKRFDIESSDIIAGNF